mgnify:CR=1 FL=1
MTTALPPRRARSRSEAYRQSLWLLTSRDLRVRYSTSFLGYFWSVLEPLVMAVIYWFVFTQIVQRSIGAEPYIVFLLAGLLPWMWFNGAVGDATRAFIKDAKLVRSTRIPHTVWVTRIVLAKGIEFLASIPVIVVFASCSTARPSSTASPTYRAASTCGRRSTRWRASSRCTGRASSPTNWMPEPSSSRRS